MTSNKLTRAQKNALSDDAFLQWSMTALSSDHFPASDMKRLRILLLSRLHEHVTSLEQERAT